LAVEAEVVRMLLVANRAVVVALGSTVVVGTPAVAMVARVAGPMGLVAVVLMEVDKT
jgi:hypothetical protein